MPSTTLVLTGSSTIAPLMGEIGARFEAANPAVRIDVQTGGSSRGIADTRQGTADLGMTSRALTPDETTFAVEHVLAYDGVAFVVHAENPVTALDDEQLRAIYTGQIDDWASVGGTGGPITVIHRAAGRSEVSLVTAYLGVDDAAVRADLISGENQHALKSVEGDPAAIVYVSLGAAARAVEDGAPIRLLPLRDVPANASSVAAGRYPLARPLLLLTSGPPEGAAAELLAYAQSPAVDDLIESLAYVPPRR